MKDDAIIIIMGMLFLFLLLLVWIPEGGCHEGDGKDKNAYRHLVAPLKIGPHIMSTRWCPGSAEVQYISVDTNRDGLADECYLLKLEHRVLHFKPTYIIIDTNTGFCKPSVCVEDTWDY